MHRPFLCSAWICVSAAVVTAADTIPEPDLILYGQVCLDGGPATDADDVAVIARTTIAKTPIEVGTYRMGQQPSASDCRGDTDCFVLRVRIETVPEGVDPSGTAVVLNLSAPATIDLFVNEGESAEAPAGQLVVSDRGVIRRLNLSTIPATADINGDMRKDIIDYGLLRGAFTGPVVETTQVCDPTDINRDGHVDLRDYAQLQAEFEGTGG